MQHKHIFSILVQNEPGVLAHVSGMFAARNFNIDSLVVGRTEDPAFSRIVLVSTGDDFTMEQVRKQLGKLVTVVKVRDLSELGVYATRCCARACMLGVKPRPGRSGAKTWPSSTSRLSSNILPHMGSVESL